MGPTLPWVKHIALAYAWAFASCGNLVLVAYVEHIALAYARAFASYNSRARGFAPSRKPSEIINSAKPNPSSLCTNV